MRPSLVGAFLVLCSGLLWAQQPTATVGPWSWRETPAGLQVDLDGEPFVVRELVQLIDRSTGWRSVYANTDPTSDRQAGALDDGRTGTGCDLRGRLSCRRETWGEGEQFHVALTCEITDPAGATDLFYSLELPGPALTGGAWRAEVEGVPVGGAIPPTGGGTLVQPMEKLQLVGAHGVVAIEASAEGAEWSLQDWRRDPHDAFRLRIELPVKQGARFEARLTFRRLQAPPVDTDEFLREVREEAMKRLDLSHAEPLRVRGVECLTKDPAVGRPCELRLDLGCTYDDPFDPADVRVEATVKTPSREYSLPAFYHTPFAFEYRGKVTVVAEGDPEWRLRLLPTEAGEHRVTVQARDRNGGATGDRLTVPVQPGEWRGPVRVSEGNPLALEWQTGEPFVPLGVNIFDKTDLGKPLPPGRIDRCLGYIDRLAAAGGDLIRLRMDSWWFAIDNPPEALSGYLGPARFNQRACADIDRIFARCDKLGVQVMLCLENANAHVNMPREGWRQRYNTYSQDNAGPCETMAEFWTDDTARELFRRKIRYCVARWGASPSLAMWEFFNEVVIGGPVEPQPVIAWHDEMAREFKRLDPYGHLVTTSPMGERDPEANRALWALDSLDIAQVHDYGHRNTGLVYRTGQHGAETFGKPFIVGEFGMRGGDVRSGAFKHGDDPDGLVAHLGHWATAMSLAAGPALDWYVSNYVDAHDLWSDFAHLRAFVADLPRNDPKLASVTVADISVGESPPPPEPREVLIQPQESWERAPHAEFAIAADGTVSPSQGLNGIIWGTQNHADLRNPPTFIVSYPRAGRFVAHVHEVVGRGENLVRITLDGETALEEDLVCEEGQGKKSEVRQPGPEGNVAVIYDRELVLDVPAGEHRIRVENLGRDRLTARYRLEGYATQTPPPPVMVVGLQHAHGAHVWVHNQTWSPEALMGLMHTVPARDVRVTLAGLPDGPVEVEWWDPMTGEPGREQAAEIRDGRLVLTIPELPQDAACKIRFAER